MKMKTFCLNSRQTLLFLAGAVLLAGCDVAPTAQQTSVGLVTPYVLDNGQFGYSETGTWLTATAQGHYGPDLRHSAAGAGENTATWQVGGLASGTYDVQMTWLAWSNQATNAPYQIYDGTTLLATLTVNQKVDPVGITISGSVFQTLGTYSITSGTLKVVLSNNANGYVIADALRIMSDVSNGLVIPHAHPRLWWNAQRIAQAKSWYAANKFTPDPADALNNALVYVVTGQTSYAQNAITQLMNFTISDAALHGVASDTYRWSDWVPMVYDWCYDVMTVAQQQTFMS